METKIGAKDMIFSDFATKASEAFYIPSLQRPYTWEAKKEVAKLFEDIVENDEGYYIGSIVSVLGAGTISRDQIIDGQQRLTTLYLILIALRDMCVEINESKLKDLIDEIDNYLIKYKKTEVIVRLSFSNEGANEVYTSLVLNKKLGKNPTDVQKRFLKNYDFLKKRIEEYIGKGKTSVIRLDDIKNRVSNLQLIFIDCKDKSAAFSLFESINATGVDLSTTDLIKNSIFETLHKDTLQYRFVEDGWNSMFKDFDENSSILKTFIRHHWISTVDYTSHSKLFSFYLNEYKTKEEVLSYATSLFESAPIYIGLRKGAIENLTKLSKRRNEVNEIKECLVFFVIFRR